MVTIIGVRDLGVGQGTLGSVGGIWGGVGYFGMERETLGWGGGPWGGVRDLGVGRGTNFGRCSY